MSHPFAVVWMTTRASGTPHAAAMLKANPELTVHTQYSAQGEGDERRKLWRNCDRNIREWWREHRDSVTEIAVLFLEYDVFCDVDLRGAMPPLAPRCGLAAASLVTPVQHRHSYWPFEDLCNLPRTMQGLACAAAPLAVLLISREALDAILSPEYDEVFAADIFCELRLPTVIRHAGYGVACMDLPHVGCSPVVPSSPGVWHPVKKLEK